MNASRASLVFSSWLLACGGAGSNPFTQTDAGGTDGGGGGADAGDGATASGDAARVPDIDANDVCPSIYAVMNVTVPANPLEGTCGGVIADQALSPSPECSGCVAADCCAAESACGTNAACVADLGCRASCSSTDGACAASCDQTYPGGAALLATVRACVGKAMSPSCPPECSTTAAIVFTCDAVCYGNGPPGTSATECSVVPPSGGADAGTVVSCTFHSPPCDFVAR